MKVYSFEPFGYEGSLFNVEVDLRRGIPAIDIVGLSDAKVGETCRTMREALKASGLDYPMERVLVSLSPADLRKRATDYVFPLALAVLDQKQKEAELPSGAAGFIDEPVLAIGTLESDGKLTPMRINYGCCGAYAAAQSAKAAGIEHIICCPEDAKELSKIPGLKVAVAGSLSEAASAARDPERFAGTSPEQEKQNGVQFNENLKKEKLWDMTGLYKTARAVEVAVAGKHGLSLVGAPGCGKTAVIQSLVPYLTPKLTDEEVPSVRRIHSLAGLSRYENDMDFKVPAFRIPHQSASIEGIFGGGVHCLPGEISLAHNGTLFLDEAAEFKSSVLQFLSVPLRKNGMGGTINLSRAGRTTVFPAKFQLMMTRNPCPCGCYGSHDKLCLDSNQSIDIYTRKVSQAEKFCAVRDFVEKDEGDKRVFDPDKARKRIARAYEIQRARGKFNNDLTAEDMRSLCALGEKENAFFERQVTESGLSRDEAEDMLRVSLTIANMDGREKIRLRDLKEAHNMVLNPLEQKEKSVPLEKEKSMEAERGR